MPMDVCSTHSDRSCGSMSDITSPVGGNSYLPSSTHHTASSTLVQSSDPIPVRTFVERRVRDSDYRTQSVPPSLPDHISSQSIGTAPYGLPLELYYGLSPSGESLCSSSDSCYSPLSDYYQVPRALPPQYACGPELVQRPHSALETNYPSIETSPMSVGPPTPGNGSTWTNAFDPSALGFIPETQCFPPVSTIRTLLMLGADRN